MGRGKLIRFTATERLFHWAYALPFTALWVTGVLHRLEVLGWKGWASRALLEGAHRGAALALLLAPPAVLLLGHRQDLRQCARELIGWRAGDFRWLGLFCLGPFRGRRRFPKVGRFNAGQKLNALASFLLVPALILSGVLLLVQKGQGALLPSLAHQFLAAFFLPFFLGHLFLALLNPGTRRALPSMVLGRVDAGWARDHHPLWYGAVAWEGHPGIHFRQREGLRSWHLRELLWESGRYAIGNGKRRKAVLSWGARTLLKGSFPLVTAWSGRKLVGVGWAVTDTAFHAFLCDVVVRENGAPAGELEGEILRHLRASLKSQDAHRSLWPEGEQREKKEVGMPCRSYFDQFLPQTLGRSLVARIENLNLVLRFAIEGEGGGDWTLVLEGGKLVEIREENHDEAEIGYQLDVPTFLAVVSGELNPQKAFFSGKVKIEGNILKALKMAVIFQGFFREYPFLAGASKSESGSESVSGSFEFTRRRGREARG